MRRITLIAGSLALLSLALLARPERLQASRALAESMAVPAAATVNISNFQFTPKVLTVKAGTTVTWLNGEGTHTVTADKGAFSSDNLTSGQSFNFKFTKAGTYRYHCSFHGSSGGGNMSGTIRVTR